MRLAVLGPNWNPLREPYAGGQESLVAALVAGLRARGHVVELYAAPGTPADLADRLFAYPATPELSATARGDVQLPEPRFLADHVAFSAAVADLAGRDGVDVVLNHSLHQLPLSLSGILPAPVVTTLHTPPFAWMEVGAALAHPSAEFVAVSEALARQWTTLTDVHVIGNGVDPAHFPAGVGGDDLVWVGRITPEKGLHVAVAAARRAGRRLHVVGPTDDPGYARTCLAGAGHVVHHGHVGHHDVARLVGSAAAILVTPLWDEPFGLVAAEAMMCATPVVGISRGGLTNVVGADGGVTVEPGPDDAAVAERLGDAVAAAVQVERAEVRAAALARLSVGAMLDRYEDLLRRVTTAAGTPTPGRGTS